MKTIFRLATSLLFASLVMAGRVTAQEVIIPDPGLNAAIRETLGKLAGPLTEQDMLSLTVLNAHDRNISDLAGLEAARNLNTLLLFNNHLTNFSLPTLTNLGSLTLSGNSLTNVSLPAGLKNLFSLLIGNNPLAQLTLPADLTGLEELGLQNCQLTSFNLPPGLTGLGVLDLGFNSLTNVSLPGGLTNLDLIRLSENSLTNFTVPTGLTRLTQLYLDQNQLASFTLPAGVTNLHVIDLFFNQLTNVTLPADLRHLISLDLSFNQLTNLNLPANLTGLTLLQARSNQLTNFILPPDLTALTLLDLGENQLRSVDLPAGLGHLINLRLSSNTNLTSLALPVGMTNLSGIFLRFNGLTNLTLPSDLNQLFTLDVLGNQLTGFTLPSGLTNLANLYLAGNQLTNLTLPPDMTRLTALLLNGNPLTQLVLSEAEAINLAATVASLQNQGIPVFTYPLDVRVTLPQQQPIGAFRFGITGPPGFYQIFGSTNLATWSALDVINNPLGSILFLDPAAQFSPQEFYRAQSLPAPPANLVFIPANTFLMGSPTNEVGHQADESPQTIVTLRHGFWIGKYEVTQAEYLAVTGENPSGFPGDLNRPVESVSLFAASNIDKNEELSAALSAAGIEHAMLNAKNHEREGEIIAEAGKKGAVTLATNMAGRGVDIKLGGPLASEAEATEVRELGGLFVLGTERHEARRIDNQLRGRSGRQGDPGETQFYVSMDDALMRVFASDTVKSMMGRFGIPEDQPIENGMITRALESAQKKIEGFHFDSRKHVLAYDDVLNQQRQIVYAKRKRLLLGSIEDVKELAAEVVAYAPETETAMEARIKELGETQWYEILRRVMLQVSDILWVEHLEVMQHTRSSVSLRAYGQQDPLIEYRKEAVRLFGEMQEAALSRVAELIPTIKVEAVNKEEEELKEAQKHIALQGGAENATEAEKGAAPIRKEERHGRNDLVTVTNGTETETMKFKKAETRLKEGWRIVE